MNEIILNISKVSFNISSINIIQLKLNYVKQENVLEKEIRNFFVRILRKSIPDMIIVYFKGDIYILMEFKDTIVKEIKEKILTTYSLVDSVELSNPKVISLDNINDLSNDDQDLIKAVIGEIISTELRNKHYIIQSITSKASAIDAFKAIGTDHIDVVGPFETYEGFIYQLFFTSEGLFLCLDPHITLINNENLREELDSENEETDQFIKLGLESKFLDTCGLKLNECEHRTSEFSLCELGGKGKVISIKKFDFNLHPDDKGLRDYLRVKERCFTGYLPDKLKNFPPVAIREVDDEEYFYPLERLRRIIDLNEVKEIYGEDITRKLTEKFQPNTNVRLQKSNMYLDSFETLQIFKNKFVKFLPFKKYSEDNKDYNSFTTKLVVNFGAKNAFPTPIGGLDKFGVYQRKDNTHPKRIKLLMFNFDDESYNQLKYRIIKFSPLKNREKTYNQLFETFFEIESVNEDQILQFKQTNSDIPIVCLTLIDRKLGNQKFLEIEKELLENGIPTQGITSLTVKKLKTQVLTNLILGIFGKAGGQPWICDCSDYNLKRLYIGVANTFDNDRDVSIIKMSLFKANGEFLKVFWKLVSRFAYDDELEKIINSIIKDFPESQIIVHRNGKILDQGEMDIYEKLYGDNRIAYVMEIIHDTVIFRVYSQEKKDAFYDVFPVEKGNFIQLDKNRFVIRSAEETPDEFQTETTILSNFVFGEVDNFIREIKQILLLSTCYTGATLYSTKLPVTLHNLSSLSNDPPKSMKDLPIYSNILL